MKHLFVGLLYEWKNEEELLQKIGFLQPQSNQYQWGFLDGLEKNIHVKPDVFAAFPTGSYPFDSKKLFIRANLVESCYGVEYLGYINTYFLREISRELKFYKKIVDYLKKANDEVTIYIYSMYYPFMKVMKKVKANYPNVRFVLIVPDLVGKETFRGKSFLKHVYHMSYAKKQYLLAKVADEYVLLTEAMKGPLAIDDKPYVVIEGFLPYYEIPDVVPKDEYAGKIIVMYAGSLNKSFGLEYLIKQFMLINDERYVLWICGAESHADYVREYEKLCGRIKYLGFLPKKKVMELQQYATMLVNPRFPDGLYTKYSFPSKTMEYILSGKPTIMFKLDGIPEEYDENLFYINESIENGLCEKMLEVGMLDKDSVEEVKDKAHTFCVNKTNEKQVAKLFCGINRRS